MSKTSQQNQEQPSGKADSSQSLGSAVETERNNLREKQVERVMPLIGGLLDAWEGMSKEMRTDPELGEVRSYMRRIDAAMEGWDL